MSKAMPRHLNAAVAAKVKGKSEAQVLNAAKRAGFDGPPWRLSLVMQACVTRAALDAYIAGKPMHAIHKAAQAAGFQGKEIDILCLLQQGTDMPRILWSGPAARTAWRARRATGRTPMTGMSNPSKYLFQVRHKGRRAWVSMVERSR